MSSYYNSSNDITTSIPKTPLLFQFMKIARSSIMKKNVIKVDISDTLSCQAIITMKTICRAKLIVVNVIIILKNIAFINENEILIVQSRNAKHEKLLSFICIEMNVKETVS